MSEDQDDEYDAKANIERLSRELAEFNRRLADVEEQLDECDGGLENRVHELEQQLEMLETDVELVDATIDGKQRGKLDKIREILEYATTDATQGYGGTKINSAEVTAAMSEGGRRTALDLMDELASSLEWAEIENPGGPVKKQLKLATEDRAVEDLMADVTEAMA